MASERNGVPTTGPLYRHQGGNAVGRLDPESLPREHDPRLDLFAEESEVGEDGGEHPAEHYGSWW